MKLTAIQQYPYIASLIFHQLELKSLEGDFNNARKIDQNLSLDLKICSQSQKMHMLQKNKEVILLIPDFHLLPSFEHE